MSYRVGLLWVCVGCFGPWVCYSFVEPQVCVFESLDVLFGSFLFGLGLLLNNKNRWKKKKKRIHL